MANKWGNNKDRIILIAIAVFLIVAFSVSTFAESSKVIAEEDFVSLLTEVTGAFAETEVTPKNNLPEESSDITVKKRMVETAPATLTEQKIEPEITYGGSDIISIIVKSTDRELLKELAISNSILEFTTVDFYSLSISRTSLSILNSSASVEKVWLDRKLYPLLDYSAPLIEANKVWNSYGYTGAGKKVCVIDTGINKTHPAIGPSRVIAEKDFTGENITADNHGHGTHVAGIVASNDATYKGIAYGASLLNARVIGNDGYGEESWVISGAEWCLEQGADILSLSLGADVCPTDGSTPLSQVVDIAVDKGKIVTIAAGNAGPQSSTIGCPSDAHKVITVGAVYKKDYLSAIWLQCNELNVKAKDLVCFSSRGPTNDSRIKPDVLAPGAKIMSLDASGNGFLEMSGTSMSTPMVAGVSALLLQAKPTLTPEEIKALLMNTVYDYGFFFKDNDFGAGMVNVSVAVKEANNTKRGNISQITMAHNIFVPFGSPEIRATLYWPENYTFHNDVDLCILDPSGEPMKCSLSLYNTDEMAQYKVPLPPGYWKLQVIPYNVNETQSYAIASNYQPSDQLYFKNESISIISYNQLNVTSIQKLEVNLDWNSDQVDLDLYLYAPDGNLTALSINFTGNHENVTVASPAIGIWLAKLVPYNLNGQPSVKYSITSSARISSQILDTIPPTVAVISPQNDNVYPSLVPYSILPSDNLDLLIDCWRTNITNGATVFVSRIYNNTYYNSTFLAPEGIHNFNVTCMDDSKNRYSTPPIRFIVDKTPPVNITNLSESGAGTDWILWNWAGPSDLDFNHTEIWLNNSFVGNTTNNSYTASGLVNNSIYEIELRPVDHVGNIGNWANDTARTLSPPPIVLAREVCNNNLGYSQGDTWRTNWNKSKNSSDPCNWYAKSHIHDLNTTISQTAAIYTEFMPGYYQGCVSPVLISVSPDNSNWVPIGNINASSHDTDGNPAYPQFWQSGNFTMLNVTPPFRYVNVSIPNCYNDWSKVIVYDTLAPLSLKPSIGSTFFFAGEGVIDAIIKPPSAGSGSGDTGSSGGGGGGGSFTSPINKKEEKSKTTSQQQAVQVPPAIVPTKITEQQQLAGETSAASAKDTNVKGSAPTGFIALIKKLPATSGPIFALIITGIILGLYYLGGLKRVFK